MHGCVPLDVYRIITNHMPPTNLAPFERILKKFLPHAHLLHAEPLTGGVSAQVTVLEITQASGETSKLVVRQHGPHDLESNPHIARDEYKLLQLLNTAGIPAAKPYFVDESAEIFPTPYIVVEYVEGQPEFAPNDLSSFIRQFAAYLARLHQMDIQSLDLSFLPDRTAIQTQRIQDRPAQLDASIDEGRIRDTLEQIWPPAPHNPTVLLHGDFWPGNAIWRDGQLVAMIDWEDACLGDPLWDLAVSRLDILWAFGMDAMLDYSHHYLQLNPIDITHLPYWDLCVALRPANQISSWAPDDPAKRRMRERHHRFVAQAFDRLNKADSTLSH
jgi:aminoglycoside phosphotransferase (APT) family kinase protein